METWRKTDQRGWIKPDAEVDVEETEASMTLLSKCYRFNFGESPSNSNRKYSGSECRDGSLSSSLPMKDHSMDIRMLPYQLFLKV